ncbi:MAG: outer membrane lipoprotein-sorting protein [Fidelibacterota bacterium]
MGKIFLIAIFFEIIFSQNFAANVILDSMIQVMSPENVESTVLQQITTSKGEFREFEYELYSGMKGENVLLRYTKPNIVKGNAILLKNHSDDIWVYFQRTRRTRKLASSSKNQKVQGSDFSYEDFSGGDTWKNDYTVNRLEDESGNFTLEFIPKSNVNTGYGKIIAIVRKIDYYPVQIKYFDKNMVHEKTLFLEDIQEIEGYPTAMKMIMTNHLEDSTTILETITTTYDISYPDDFFTEKSLRK